MLFRAFLVLIFLAALASFGYGFWLVLAPEGHSWRVDIPLDPRDATSRGTGAADDAAAYDAARQPGATSAADSGEAPPPVVVGERPIALALPIDCTPGADCWIVNYVDVDPSEARQDYRCGQMSYDGHKGTDIALANEARIQDTVPVLAAAAGKVLGTRDGEPDAGTAGMAAAKAAGKECGNGVRIDHGDGWATQYCHLRKGSVLVQPGQEVEVGQTLGAVGLSGMTQFPHVHISLVHDGEVIDPFRGIAGAERCGLGKQPLWDDETLRDLAALQAPVLLDASFFDALPDEDAVASGEASRTTLAPDAGAVVAWFRAAGVAPGDTGRVVITAPDGSVVIDETATFDRHQAAVYRAFGIRNSPERFPDGLPLGDWKAHVVLMRDGEETGERIFAVTVAVSG